MWKSLIRWEDILTVFINGSCDSKCEVQKLSEPDGPHPEGFEETWAALLPSAMEEQMAFSPGL